MLDIVVNSFCGKSFVPNRVLNSNKKEIGMMTGADFYLLIQAHFIKLDQTDKNPWKIIWQSAWALRFDQFSLVTLS